MLGPMREHDYREDLERALVPRSIQLFDQALHDGERPNKGGKAKLSPDSRPSSAVGFHQREEGRAQQHDGHPRSRGRYPCPEGPARPLRASLKDTRLSRAGASAHGQTGRAPNSLMAATAAGFSSADKSPRSA